MGELFHFNLDDLLYRVVAFVLAFTVHEWAHAYTAYKLGDLTAKRQGRLTLNPLPHVDPFGLLMILFGPFGWAKPVPFNPFMFKGNRRLGIVFVAFAGPLTNLILAFLFAFVFSLTVSSGWFFSLSETSRVVLGNMLFYIFFINAALFIFNLLPVAPLDGSKIVRYLLPSRFDSFFENVERYGPFILLLIILVDPIGDAVLWPLFNGALQLIASITGISHFFSF
ncbi:MAG: site-2 protease family protein [Bacillaceae bacterium]|nr:site-2 protease family protein [Bacillaceae bacterium]